MDSVLNKSHLLNEAIENKHLYNYPPGHRDVAQRPGEGRGALPVGMRLCELFFAAMHTQHTEAGLVHRSSTVRLWSGKMDFISLESSPGSCEPAQLPLPRSGRLPGAGQTKGEKCVVQRVNWPAEFTATRCVDGDWFRWLLKRIRHIYGGLSRSVSHAS